MPTVSESRSLTTHPAFVVPPDTPIIVTIDGPAGTGKSTVARTLAAQLGLDFLDTGAMYRAAAAIVIDHQVDPDRSDAIVERVASADLHFDWSMDPPGIMAWLVPLNERIRDADVTRLVSPLASIPELREHMVRKQRIIGRQHPRLVTEGRDQGSVVFPDAEVKFFLSARPEVRAERRAAQLRRAGRDADASLILADILERDRLDSTRVAGPLVCPDDAIQVDTSDLEFAEVVRTLEARVRDRVASLL
ncbi:MAG: (d)CMP kinase [Planctomycetota bacterium]